MKRVAVVVGLLAVYFLFLHILFGQGVGTTEKASFEGVYSPYLNSDVIIFKKVWARRTIYGNMKTYIFMKPDKPGMIVVKVDSELSNTLISVEPTFWGKWTDGFPNAKKVTIWVSNEEEKAVWEEWVKRSEKFYFGYREQENKPPQAQKIIPKLD